jgi:hypothetical protein
MGSGGVAMKKHNAQRSNLKSTSPAVCAVAEKTSENRSVTSVAVVAKDNTALGTSVAVSAAVVGTIIGGPVGAIVGTIVGGAAAAAMAAGRK